MKREQLPPAEMQLVSVRHNAGDKSSVVKFPHTDLLGRGQAQADVSRQVSRIAISQQHDEWLSVPVATTTTDGAACHCRCRASARSAMRFNC